MTTSNYTHYLIMQDRSAVGVMASSNTHALEQAEAMGIIAGVVRVDEAMSEEEWIAATTKPTTLNGFAVVLKEVHPNGFTTVMVHVTDNTYTPYCVATWWPNLHNGWQWGHYLE